MKDKMKGNSDDRDGTHRQHRREEKGINVEVYCTTMHDSKLVLISTLLEEMKCEVFEHSLYSTDIAPCD